VKRKIPSCVHVAICNALYVSCYMFTVKYLTSCRAVWFVTASILLFFSLTRPALWLSCTSINRRRSHLVSCRVVWSIVSLIVPGKAVVFLSVPIIVPISGH